MAKKGNRKTVKSKRSIFADMPLGMSIAFIILGLIIAVVFNLDSMYFNRMIEREDAIAATGSFESYEYLYSPKGGGVSEVRIYFSDREELYLDSYRVEMDEKLEALERGEKLDMMLHPNSEYIWEISSEDGVIIAFDDIKSIARTDNILFSVILGGFGLFYAVMGIVSLLVKCRKYKKQRGLKENNNLVSQQSASFKKGR